MAQLGEPLQRPAPAVPATQTRAEPRPLAALCQEAFREVDSSGEGRVDLPQLQAVLQRVFSRLSGVVPQPDDAWFAKVFNNYAPRCGGAVNLKCIEDVAQQYYAHHIRKSREGQKTQQVPESEALSAPPQKELRPEQQQFQKLAGIVIDRQLSEEEQAVGAKVPTRQQLQQPKPVHQVRQPLHERQPQPQQQQLPDRKPSDVQLASVVMFPTTRARMAVYEHYEFDSQVLGEGSFGQVILVKHKITGQRRACKCMGMVEEEDWCLAQTEVELMKRLDHPNILRLSESFIDGRNIYLIAELCEGGPLLEGFAHRGGSVAAVTSCLRQMLGAAAYCHGKGIIHRDLKPDNVLYVSRLMDSTIKVIDFGLANFLERLRGSERMQRAGTLPFMAPEIITENVSYTEKVDVWSIGCILYMLLTGRHPFHAGKGTRTTELRAHIVNGTIIEHPNWMAAPQQAQDLVRRLLVVDPSQRMSAAEALQHAWLKSITQDIRRDSAAGPVCIPRSVFEGLWRYQASNRLKKAALKLLAKEVDEARIRSLREHFLALDCNQDGCLDRDDILIGMRRHLEQHNLKSADLTSVLPPEAGGQISCTSFTAALLAQQGFVRAELLNAFRRFDIHNEGKISPSTLAEVLKVSAPNSNHDILNEADFGQDGAIDFEEFCALIHN